MIAFERAGLDLGGRTILAEVNLAIAAGEFVCLIGPSGCGKTSLLRLVAGLERPSRGAVRVDGRPVMGPSRRVAFVFQDYGRALLPWRSAAGNVRLALEATAVPRGEREETAARLLEALGLGAHAAKHPYELSGGMQQRLQIARCLAQRPDLFLWDEPFGALDAMTRQSLQDEVLRLSAEQGTTNLFVTHDLEEALYLADRVVALAPNPGRVRQVLDVPLPRPRDPIATREDPLFLALRRELFALIGDHP